MHFRCAATSIRYSDTPLSDNFAEEYRINFCLTRQVLDRTDLGAHLSFPITVASDCIEVVSEFNGPLRQSKLHDGCTITLRNKFFGEEIQWFGQMLQGGSQHMVEECNFTLAKSLGKRVCAAPYESVDYFR
jgi:hypothetical protein